MCSRVEKRVFVLNLDHDIHAKLYPPNQQPTPSSGHSLKFDTNVESMASSSISLLSLPNELIYNIIDFTRPDGFENILLACKHTYAVGFPLINERSLGKRWASYAIQGRGFGSQPTAVLQFQQILAATPKQVREWIGLYINQINLRRDSSRFRSRTFFSTNPNRQTSIPSWLRDELYQLVNDVPELDPERRASLAAKEVASDQGLEWHYDLWLSLSGRCCAYGTFTQIPVLFLFTNLRRLSLQAMTVPFDKFLKKRSFVDSHVVLAGIIRRHHGQRYFQQLEELKVNENSESGIKYLSSWILLPKLKALMVHGLNDIGRNTETMLAINLPAGFKSSIEHLVLSRVKLKEETMRKLFTHLNGLQTLVWQQVKNTPKRSFRPKILARLLARGSSGSLRFLVVTTKHEDPGPIVRTDQIHHFKRFSKLTHIAIDLNLLRPKSIFLSGQVRGCKTRSLTKVLPRQIEVLAIHVKEDKPDALRAMLRHLRKKISLFPNLRLIEIRFVCLTAPTAEFMKQIKLMRKFLRAVNVSLEWGHPRYESANLQSNVHVLQQITSMDWFFNSNIE